MKRFAFIFASVLMAFLASAQSDSILLLYVPSGQSVTLDCTGEISPKERATKIYLLPSEPDTLTTYKTVDGDTVKIYSLPARYNTSPQFVEVGIDGTIGDYVTPYVHH